MDNLELAFLYFIEEEDNIQHVCKRFKITKDEFKSKLLEKLYYKINDTIDSNSIRKFYNASLYYLDNSELGFYKVGKLFKIDPTKFKQHMLKYYPETKKLDETIFDTIDTEEKAYWLGFLYADGYISKYEKGKTGYLIELSLLLYDINHLQKFKEFTKSVNNITSSSILDIKSKRYSRCRFSINSKKVWENLHKLGCVNNKSLILTFPDVNEFKDEKLIKHFIRGYWDGDGCLTYKRSNCITISVIGTNNFLNGVLQYFNTNKLLYPNLPNNGITKVLKYNGKQAFEITKLLYKDATIYLDRKYKKYLEYCRLYEESYKELESKIGEDCDVNPEVN